MANYEYWINLDERGEFFADVRDADGKTILETHSNLDGEIDLVTDGYMRHGRDLAGLREYLVDVMGLDVGRVVLRDSHIPF